jgi:MFS family permease
VIRRPIFILVLLTGLNFLNYLDRFVLAAVLVRVRDDLHLTGAMAGALAPAFLVGYGVASPIFGALADRGFKRTTLLFLGVVIWSIATFWSGLSHDFWTLLAARTVVGVGEASYAAVAPAFIDDVAPPASKGKWLAVFYSATPVGSALGFLVGGILQKHYGWQAAFQMVGGPGIVLAITCLFVAEVARHEKETKPPSLRALLHSPAYVRTVVGYCLQTFTIGGFAHWGPTAVHEMYGWKLETVDIIFGALLVVSGFLATAVGGVLGDRAAAKARARGGGDIEQAWSHTRLCAISSAIGAPFALACVWAPSAPLFFLFIFIAEVGIFLSTSPINAAILLSVPTALRTSAMGLSIFAIHAFGDFWSPPLVGALSDHLPWRLALTPLATALALSAIAWWPPTPKRA